MTALDALDSQAISDLLTLATTVAGGEPIALLDGEERLIAGRAPEADRPRRRPLGGTGGAIGTIVSSSAVRPELLELIGRSLELVLADADLRSARARVDQELAIGRRIQLALVPRRFPAVEGWSFAAAYEPALEVGGDLYDAFNLRGRTDQLGLLVADVTGKGIPAALLMADVRALLHAAADNASGPADALDRVNRILVRERATALMVTAALLLVDAATGAVRYAGAGHEPILVARAAGGVETFEAGGTILGLSGTTAFEDRVEHLSPGDALVLYTDGITDARDDERRFYGQERLLHVVEGACGRPAEAIVKVITEDVRAFRGGADAFDDLTLLVVERHRA